MSGVAVIRSLLATNSAILSALGAGPPIASSRIISGTMPLLTVLPAIEVRQISGVPRLTVAMTEANRMNTDRVQVSVLFKGAKDAATGVAYPAAYGNMRALLKLVLAACPNQRGTVNGVYVDSILPLEEGPDLYSEELAMHQGSRDFAVRWATA